MGQKKEGYHVQPLTEGKKNIIAALTDEYDIQNTDDIQEALNLCFFPLYRSQRSGVSRFMAGEVFTTSSVLCTKAECLIRKLPGDLARYER